MVPNAWSFVEEYEQLSDNQKQAVELPYDQNQLITGVSGSGKTVVAGHRAIRIKENLNVQILVFNKLLHESLQQSLGDKLDETEITTLVTWFKEWFKKEYEQEPPKDDDSVWPNWHKCKEIHSRHRLLHDQIETAGTHFIIDEAQNLTAHEVKTILTRVGENTKIVLTGDIEQIDNIYTNETSNGLTYAVEKFKHHDISGHITFLKGERSRLATISSKIL